jgi:hypothetical protein
MREKSAGDPAFSRAKEEASMERERADTSLESRGCFVIESERILRETRKEKTG